MIRKGRLDDFNTIMEQGIPYMRAQMVVPEDIRLIGAGVLQSLENDEVLYAEVNGEFAGCCAFEVGRFWYSSQDVFLDKWLGISPKYRNGLMAGRMLKALEAEADQRGIPFIPMPTGDLSNIASFSKRYKTVGMIFKKDAA